MRSLRTVAATGLGLVTLLLPIELVFRQNIFEISSWYCLACLPLMGLIILEGQLLPKAIFRCNCTESFVDNQ